MGACSQGKPSNKGCWDTRNFPQLNKNNEQSELAKDQWHSWSKVISHLSVSTLFLASASEISSEIIAMVSGKTPRVNL